MDRLAWQRLLVDPGRDSLGIRADAVGEPERNLALGILDAVRAVADVAANVNGIVAADGSRVAGEGIGLAEDLAAGLYDVLSLEDLRIAGAAADTTMAKTGLLSIKSTRPPKKGFAERSA